MSDSSTVDPHQKRKREILKSLFEVSGFGLEIGPQASGLVPKREGYNVRIVDWCSGHELRTFYQNSTVVDATKIEDVDYITGGKSLSEAVPQRGVFDYIVASHVIEHIPDIVQFLKDCEALLKPTGRVVVAVPDKRYTFDVFRPLTSVGDLMQAHLDKAVRHPPGRILDFYCYAARRQGGGYIWGPEHTEPFSLIYPITEARRQFDDAAARTDYIDAHGWTFIPASFRLLMHDLAELDEIKLRETALETHPPEFYVALSPSAAPCSLSRETLLERVLTEWRVVTA